jgi:hypothetical protein
VRRWGTGEGLTGAQMMMEKQSHGGLNLVRERMNTRESSRERVTVVESSQGGAHLL